MILGVYLEQILPRKVLEWHHEVVPPHPGSYCQKLAGRFRGNDLLSIKVCSDGLALRDLAPNPRHLLVVPRSHVLADFTGLCLVNLPV